MYGRGVLVVVVEGEIRFANGLTLRVREFVDFKQGRIADYSYAIYRGEEKIRWYDPQPHPEDPKLASTFPHHFHEEPDSKHNRKPAPRISFTAPNLPALIEACAGLGG